MGAGKTAGTAGLAFVFMMVAADVAMAGGLGMIGVHGAVVEGGMATGQALGVPQLDWFNLWENGEFSVLDPATDPCLSAGGHYHGSYCHYPSAPPVADVAQLPSTSTPAPTIDSTFD